jgi:putative MFS transporter
VALRTTGMGSAYGFGGLGKVIGPLGLALIVGSSNIITPKASVDALFPAFCYLAAWFAAAGFAYIFIGMETKGRSLESIELALESPARSEERK